MNDCGQATVNPIMRIPIEVLGIIMRWTLPFPLESVTNWRRDPNGWTYSRTLMLLRQIFCSWRYAVVADGELWATLPCELPESLFALHLERSGGQAITLYFAYSYLGLSTSADGPERLVFNLLRAIGTGNPIQELSALLTPERLDYLLEQSHYISTSYPSAFRLLKSLKIHSPSRTGLQLELLFSAALSSGSMLQRLELVGCVCEWERLAQLTRLTHFHLDLKYPYYITPRTWRTILEHLSSHL
jgi:hypothetical protein